MERMRFTDVEVLDSDKQTNKSDQTINEQLVCNIYHGSKRGTFRVRCISSMYESCSEYGEGGSNGALHWRGLNMYCFE